jgi:hypothetical protein
MTPLIENLDADATNRLENRLKDETEVQKRESERRAQIRKELIEDTRRREAYIKALERLSGVKRVSTLQPTENSYCINDRIDKLSRPREQKHLTPTDCLDGLELVHISNPEALDTLHKNSV